MLGELGKKVTIGRIKLIHTCSAISAIHFETQLLRSGTSQATGLPEQCLEAIPEDWRKENMSHSRLSGTNIAGMREEYNLRTTNGINLKTNKQKQKKTEQRKNTREKIGT